MRFLYVFLLLCFGIAPIVVWLTARSKYQYNINGRKTHLMTLIYYVMGILVGIMVATTYLNPQLI